MKLAIASGKGGAGKTMVATNLAWTAAQQGVKTAFLDCDVEEPNAALFLKPDIENVIPVHVPKPVINQDVCTHCGLCSDICRYNALAVLSDKVLLFNELCHSCGGCVHVCPEHAIHEEPRLVGHIDAGHAGALKVCTGVLKVGEAIAPPVVKAVKQQAGDETLTILDSPPGTACPAVETVRDADFVLFVAEATPFGRHDLALAIDLAQALKRPFAVMLNRADLDHGETRRWCEENGFRVLAEIDEDRRIAEKCSSGELVVDALPDYREVFTKLLEDVVAAAEITTNERVQG
ncbi:ATP-binding protein [bacterium]|nr:ATP-binding protein [bacterium]